MERNVLFLQQISGLGADAIQQLAALADAGDVDIERLGDCLPNCGSVDRDVGCLTQPSSESLRKENNSVHIDSSKSGIR
jgi:hypothetical protein